MIQGFQATPNLLHIPFFSISALGGVDNAVRYRVEQCAVLDVRMSNHAKHHAVKYSKLQGTAANFGPRTRA
jgi:hypothetical protein